MKKLTVLLSLFPFFVSAQSLQPGFGLIADSIANIYKENQKETLPIHYGRLFYGYPGVIGEAFYPLTLWQKGSVLFDDNWYHDVSIMYDTYTDDVILLHPNSTPLRLFAERIRQFNFNGLNFIRLTPDKNKVLKTGFYHQVVQGDIAVLVKRIKNMEESIIDMNVERKFVDESQYYIEKSGQYYHITTRKELLNLLKDRRHEITRHLKYLKSQNLRFKKDKEAVIVEIAKLYNEGRR